MIELIIIGIVLFFGLMFVFYKIINFIKEWNIYHENIYKSSYDLMEKKE